MAPSPADGKLAAKLRQAASSSRLDDASLAEYLRDLQQEALVLLSKAFTIEKSNTHAPRE